VLVTIAGDAAVQADKASKINLLVVCTKKAQANTSAGC
jgi:hypothetical protein